jgi:N6-L-threonylcarbamoyladenine synthase
LPILLAIESSCDDTSAAVVMDGLVLSNVVASQKIHELYGGVVPEVASRQHHIDILPVVKSALDKADITKSQLDAIAFTRGPGLMGSLLVGVNFAKGLALALDKPMIEVHHMHAHILAHFAEQPSPSFPFLCLTVSGGHTQIVLVKAYNEMEVLGTTIDDAAGEAFDKVGKMLGLGYPAGPEIDNRSKNGKPIFTFAEPNLPNLDFSFSGFKTSVLYFLQAELKKNKHFIDENLDNICASVQYSIVNILIKKIKKAVKQTGVTQVAIAGGVAANSGLRAALNKMIEEDNCKVFIPAFQYCTDNAGMIGIAAYYKYLDGVFVGQEIAPDPKLKF